jgi:hypothetical protein
MKKCMVVEFILQHQSFAQPASKRPTTTTTKQETSATNKHGVKNKEIQFVL